MKLVNLVVLVLLLVGGCASHPTSQTAHVLSGDAPVEMVTDKADALAVEGDFRAAALLYQQALHRDPSAEIWYRLGMTWRMLERPDEALFALKQALELDPDHPRALERVALHLTAAGEAEQANAYLERLVALEPRNWRVHNARGVLADLQERHDYAAAQFEIARKLNPTSPIPLSNLGFSLYLAGDYEAALVAMAEVLRHHPDHQPARRNAALVLARQQQYEQARQILVGNDGDETQAYTLVGHLALQLGDYMVAEKYLSEAISRSPTYNSQAHQSLARVRKEARGG